MINNNAFRTKKNGECYKRSFCAHPELIENYDLAMADTEIVWHCHHRLENIFTKQELISKNIYYNIKPGELIFLRPVDHNNNSKLHCNIGHKAWNKGISYIDTYNEQLRKAKFGTPKVYIKCIETGEVHYQFEWKLLGFTNAGSVAAGRRKSNKGYHFLFLGGN